MITMILLMLLQTAMLVLGQVALKLGMADMPKWEWSWSYIWHEVILNAWLMAWPTAVLWAKTLFGKLVKR